MNWKKDEYLAHWPGAVPYPYAIARSKRPVPNRSSVDWPQAQWAPLFLPPGSPSVQPYRYPKDGPIQSIVPQMYMIQPVKMAQQGPPGDTVAAQGAQGAISCTEIETIPLGYGAVHGPTHRMGMRPAKRNPMGAPIGFDQTLSARPMMRRNPCGCAYGADCDCGRRARLNEGEGEESFLKKHGLLLAGVAALGYWFYTKR